jgi:aconitate hydratase
MSDHLFLRSACQRFGVWYSRPGNEVSHPVHMQRFGRPGASLAGSDSHTCAAGSLGMLAIGVGGLEVAMAMAGEPLYVTMPEIWGVRLTGTLPPCTIRPGTLMSGSGIGSPRARSLWCWRAARFPWCGRPWR